jgi:hypothetical protein
MDLQSHWVDSLGDRLRKKDGNNLKTQSVKSSIVMAAGSIGLLSSWQMGGSPPMKSFV